MIPEHLAVVTELARGVQRYAMYPSGHPSRGSTAQLLTDRLEELLSGEREGLEITIRKDRLVLSSGESDPANPLYAGLALRLYQHQLRSLLLGRGVEAREVEGLLTAVAQPLGRSGVPLGAAGSLALQQWPHIHLEPVAYESLTIAREPASGTGPLPAGSVPEAGEMGGSGEELGGEEETGSDAQEEGEGPGLSAFEFPQLTRVMRGEAPSDPAAFRQEITRLILKTPPKTLGRLIKAVPGLAGSAAEGADSLTSAVADLVERAGGEREGPGASFLRILTKLGTQTDTPSSGEGAGEDPSMGPDPGGQDLGELVRELGAEWQIDDPNPEDYGRALREFSRQSPILSTEPFWLEEPEPVRIVQMSLELDEAGRITFDAVASMLGSGELATLLGLLDAVGEDSRAAAALWPDVARPETVRRLLAGQPPDLGLLDRLLPHLKQEGIEAILDALEAAEAARLRQGLAERLVALGLAAGPLVAVRLEGAATTIRRDLMAVLAVLPALPPDFSPEPWLVDPDAGVRREAFRIALASMEDREVPIAAAISDTDDQIIALGLNAAEVFCPATLVPLIRNLVLGSGSAASLRLTGIRALARSGTTEARQTLLRLTWRRRFILGRALAPKSAEMLESLSALYRNWPDDPVSRRVIQAAERSRDPQIRAVVRTRKGTL
jgi:hypothetical protein